MTRQPKIISIPLDHAGTHETFVVVIDGVARSLDTWNFVEDEKGNRTFFVEGVTDWQLHFMANVTVQVIRS